MFNNCIKTASLAINWSYEILLTVWWKPFRFYLERLRRYVTMCGEPPCK